MEFYFPNNSLYEKSHSGIKMVSLWRKINIYWFGTSRSLSGWVAKPVQSAPVRHDLNTMLHFNNVFIASGIFSVEI